MQRTIAGLAALAATVGCAGSERPTSLLDGHWIDLTHDFADDAVYWPTADPFQLEVVSRGKTEAGYFYAANRFAAAEHGGTHVDAPIHFAEGGWTLAEIPLEKLIGPAAVVDVSGAAARDRDYLVGVADLEAWESQHGRLPDGAIRIPWPYTQSELAGMIGGSRQSVNRLLADLTDEGLVRMERDVLVVTDRDRLAGTVER